MMRWGGTTRRQSHGGTHPLKSRRALERVAMILLLFVAWAWIMVTFGMVFYHGYYAHHWSSQHHADGPLTQNQIVPVHQDPVALGGSQGQAVPGRLDSASTGNDLQPFTSPLLIFTCQRANYLQTTLETILRYIPNDCSMGCPVIVSQDGRSADVAAEIQRFQESFQQQKGIPVVHLTHTSALRGGHNAYQALAVHYGWALKQVFDGKATAGLPSRNAMPQRVLILEEDIRIAPDFFSYFASLAPLLESDPTLLAVSAFNDNGFSGRVKDVTRVVRSDFFPGLGWMMTRKLWDQELAAKWPKGYWDDWLRDPAQRQGRQVLRPEISRTFHFGSKGGASANQFGDRLDSVYLNEETVDWKAQDLTYLHEDRFDREYWRMLQSTRRVSNVQEGQERVKEGNVRLEYFSFMEYQSFAKPLGLMSDEKAGVPRTAYHGVVETRPLGENILFLTPPLKQLQKDFANVL